MITVDWLNFTPFSSFFGGLLIGSASVLLMLTNGRIAGVSGLLSKVLINETTNKLWVLLFFVGLVIGPVFYSTWIGPIQSNQIAGTPWLILAGLFVGFGTFVGNGCTSGHGICGLSRFSKRSLIAVLTFVLSGAFTVYSLKLFGAE